MFSIATKIFDVEAHLFPVFLLLHSYCIQNIKKNNYLGFIPHMIYIFDSL